MTSTDVARVCHQANKALCEAIGDNSQEDWKNAEDWQRLSAVNGVEFFQDNPDAPDSAQHDAWAKEKTDAGWKYGETKDAIAKTHPCLVSFEDLPAEQQAKDTLFKGVCRALVPLITEPSKVLDKTQ